MRPCPIPLSRFLAQAYLGATLRPAIFDHDKYGSVPSGTNAVSEGSRLTLTVIRRIRAGQCEHPAKTPNPYGFARNCAVVVFWEADGRSSQQWRAIKSASPIATTPRLHLGSRRRRHGISAARRLGISHRGPRAARGTSFVGRFPKLGQARGALIDFYDMISYAALGRAWCKGGYRVSFRQSFNRRHYRHGTC